MTVEYYNQNAEAFRQRTIDRDLDHLYDKFLTRLPAGGHILDAGCGPGRDTLAFLKRGYRVTAVDASQAMVELATKLTGQPALLLPFGQIEWENALDGVWACASLLHVPTGQFNDVLARLARSLKTGGILYASFKVGDGERTTKDGRLFCDYTPKTLRQALARHPSLEVIELYESEPWAGQCEDKAWLHATATRMK